MIQFTHKNEPFVGESEPQSDFELMQNAVTTAPALQHFNYEREVFVKTDSYDYLSVADLSLYDDKGVLHPVVYFSMKLIPSEYNCDMYDMERIRIIETFKEWRPKCEEVAYPLQF